MVKYGWSDRFWLKTIMVLPFLRLGIYPTIWRTPSYLSISNLPLNRHKSSRRLHGRDTGSVGYARIPYHPSQNVYTCSPIVVFGSAVVPSTTYWPLFVGSGRCSLSYLLEIMSVCCPICVTIQGCFGLYIVQTSIWFAIVDNKHLWHVCIHHFHVLTHPYSLWFKVYEQRRILPLLTLTPRVAIEVNMDNTKKISMNVIERKKFNYKHNSINSQVYVKILCSLSRENVRRVEGVTIVKRFHILWQYRFYTYIYVRWLV